MVSACVRIGCGLVALVLLAGDVRGGPAPRRRREATAHFDAADRAFRAGRYDEALARLEAGYALEPRPEFLIAFAQTYRELGRIDDAVEQCQRYRAVAPHGPLVEPVRELERELRRERARKPTRDAAGDDSEDQTVTATATSRELASARDLTPMRDSSTARALPPGRELSAARELSSARELPLMRELSPAHEPASARELSPARDPSPAPAAFVSAPPPSASRGHRRALTWGLVVGSVGLAIGVGLGVGLGLGLHAAPPDTALGSVSFH